MYRKISNQKGISSTWRQINEVSARTTYITPAKGNVTEVTQTAYLVSEASPRALRSKSHGRCDIRSSTRVEEGTLHSSTRAEADHRTGATKP